MHIKLLFTILLNAILLILSFKNVYCIKKYKYADVYVTNTVTIAEIASEVRAYSTTITETKKESSTLSVYSTLFENMSQPSFILFTKTTTVNQVFISLISKCNTSTIGPLYFSSTHTKYHNETDIQTIYQIEKPKITLFLTTTDTYCSTFISSNHSTTTSTDVIFITTCEFNIEKMKLSIVSTFQNTEKSIFNSNFKNCNKDYCDFDNIPLLFECIFDNYVDVTSFQFADINSIYNSWTATFSVYQSSELAAISMGFGKVRALNILTSYTSKMLAAWSAWTQSQIVTLSALDTHKNSVKNLTGNAWPSQISLLSSILSVESILLTSFLSANSTLF